jgi:hypothetical protein
VVDRSVGIALGYELDDRGFESWQRLGISLLTTAFRPALGLSAPLFNVYQGDKVDQLHLVPSLRMRGVILLLPRYAFMVLCSAKARGQLYLLLIYCKENRKREIISTNVGNTDGFQERIERTKFLVKEQ